MHTFVVRTSFYCLLLTVPLVTPLFSLVPVFSILHFQGKSFAARLDSNALSDPMYGERSIKNERTEKQQQPKFSFLLSNRNCIVLFVVFASSKKISIKNSILRATAESVDIPCTVARRRILVLGFSLFVAFIL